MIRLKPGQLFGLLSELANQAESQCQVKLFLSASAELAWFTSGPVLGLNSYFRKGVHRDEQTSVSAPVIVAKNS